MKKNKDYYLNLDYPVVVKKLDEAECAVYSAEIIELPGLKVYCDSIEESYAELLEAKKIWIEAALAENRKIVEPCAITDDISGRVTLRMGKNLHLEIKQLAQTDSVTLNSKLIELLQLGIFNNNIELLQKEVSELREDNRNLIRNLNEVRYRLSNNNNNYSILEDDEEWKTQTSFHSTNLLWAL